jgi:hypothetical protein
LRRDILGTFVKRAGLPELLGLPHVKDPRDEWVNLFLGLLSPSLSMALSDLLFFLGPLFLISSAIGLVVAWRDRQLRPVLLVSLPLVLTVFFYGNLDTYGPRYLAFCALGLAMLAGVAVCHLVRRGGWVRIGAIATCVLTLSWMFVASYPLLAPRRVYNGAKRFALLVAETTEPESAIIVMDDRRFIQYYARRETIGHPIDDPPATEIWIEELKTRLERQPVYLVSSGLSYDDSRTVERALEANFTFLLVGEGLAEDFHAADRKLAFYDGKIFLLRPK